MDEHDGLATAEEWRGLSIDDRRAYLAALNPMGQARFAQRLAEATGQTRSLIFRSWIYFGVFTEQQQLAALAAEKEEAQEPEIHELAHEIARDRGVPLETARTHARKVIRRLIQFAVGWDEAAEAERPQTPPAA